MMLNRSKNDSIGLASVVAKLAPNQCTLDQLSDAGKVVSDVSTLSDFGFDHLYVVTDLQQLQGLARDAAAQAIDEALLEPGDIDALIWVCARPQTSIRRHGADEPINQCASSPLIDFRYAAGWLQNELSLDQAEVLSVGSQGCASMFTAIQLAHAMLVADPSKNNILCVGADALDPNSSREIMYNVISDAACAVVVSRHCRRNLIQGFHQVSRGHYWDPIARNKEIIAAYFPTAKLAIDQLLQNLSLLPTDVNAVIPTGVNQRSWPILMQLVGIPEDRLMRVGTSFGHTITSDNFIYLQRLTQANEIENGSRMLLFTYGFGSTWSCLMLKH